MGSAAWVFSFGQVKADLSLGFLWMNDHLVQFPGNLRWLGIWLQFSALKETVLLLCTGPVISGVAQVGCFFSSGRIAAAPRDRRKGLGFLILPDYRHSGRDLE